MKSFVTHGTTADAGQAPLQISPSIPRVPEGTSLGLLGHLNLFQTALLVESLAPLANRA
jgi:hypothetical protein